MTAEAWDDWGGQWADEWEWTDHAIERLHERCAEVDPADLIVTGSTQHRWRRGAHGRIEANLYVPVSDVDGSAVWLVIGWCVKRGVVVVTVVPDIPWSAHAEPEMVWGGGE